MEAVWLKVSEHGLVLDIPFPLAPRLGVQLELPEALTPVVLTVGK